jgi:hypothetical protein
MQRITLPPEVAAAVAVLLSHITNTIRLAANDSSAAPPYYDATTSPTGPRAFRRAAQRGAFPTYRVGRKLVARREDVHAWIEAQPRRPKRRPGDDDRAFLEASGLRLRKGEE